MSKKASNTLQDKSAAKGEYREPVGRAPDEDEPANEAKGDDKPKAKKAMTGEEILQQDFQWMESNIFSGKPPTEKSAMLYEKQWGFIVDRMDHDQVMAHNGGENWLRKTMTGKAFYAQFPGTPTWYSGECSKMSLNFMQTDLKMRASDLIQNTTDGGPAMVLALDKKEFWDYTEMAKERTDNHALVKKISITDCNTKRLPHGCEFNFWTGADGGMMRKWKRPKSQRTYSNVAGMLDGVVLDPATEFRRLANSVIYETDMEHMCSPWISRCLQFNFDRFLNETVRGFAHVIQKNPEFIRIKAPQDENSTEFNEIQWFLFAFFRYLSFETKRRMKELMGPDGDEKALAGVGKTVVQERYAYGAKPGEKPIGYEFVISKMAMEHVVKTVREKVRAAVILANFDRVAVSLDLIGGPALAKEMQERMNLMEKSNRDELERDPFVTPFSVGLEIEYIALPHNYPAMEAQSAANLGEGNIALVKQRVPMPPVRPLGTSGRHHCYGVNSFRHSMNVKHKGKSKT